MSDDYHSDPSQGIPQQHTANSTYGLREQAAQLGIQGAEHAGMHTLRRLIDQDQQKRNAAAPAQGSQRPVMVSINAPHKATVRDNQIAITIAPSVGAASADSILPPYPTDDGLYVLTVTINSGAATLAWTTTTTCA